MTWLNFLLAGAATIFALTALGAYLWGCKLRNKIREMKSAS